MVKIDRTNRARPSSPVLALGNQAFRRFFKNLE
jgi:hypothetical protein